MKKQYNYHHPIPTSRQRNDRVENIEDKCDIHFRKLHQQTTTRMKAKVHSALHEANSSMNEDGDTVPLTPREMLYRYLHINHKVMSNQCKVKLIQALQMGKEFYEGKFVR